MVSDRLALFNLSTDQVYAYVTDNCSTMEKLWDSAHKDLGIEHVGCFCHILNIIIERALRMFCSPPLETSAAKES